MQKILTYILQFGVILFSLSVHESAHAWMADRCGDPTARRLGRVTLNPIPHIDPIGTIIFPLILIVLNTGFVFGWAKPVPVNLYNMRNPRRGNLLTSAAGPASNIALAIISTVVFLALKPTGLVALEKGAILGIMIFQLIVINVILAIFNLLPIPPLDGSGILESTLRGDALYHYNRIKPYGFIILMVVIMSNLLDKIAGPIIIWIARILGYTFL